MLVSQTDLADPSPAQLQDLGGCLQGQLRNVPNRIVRSGERVAVLTHASSQETFGCTPPASILKGRRRGDLLII